MAIEAGLRSVGYQTTTRPIRPRLYLAPEGITGDGAALKLHYAVESKGNYTEYLTEGPYTVMIDSESESVRRDDYGRPWEVPQNRNQPCRTV